MHKYPQNQSCVGSNGQTRPTNVSMTLCNWQIRHQTHVLCGRTTFVPNQTRPQINTVPTPAVAWTRACLTQRGGGVLKTVRGKWVTYGSVDRGAEGNDPKTQGNDRGDSKVFSDRKSVMRSKWSHRSLACP